MDQPKYRALDLGNLCANLPHVLLSANVFGGSGPTGSGMYVAKITSGLNQYGNINNTLTTPVNNTLTEFILDPGLVLGNDPPCGSANGPVAAWGRCLGGTSATVTFSVYTNTAVNNVNTPGTLLDTLTETPPLPHRWSSTGRLSVDVIGDSAVDRSQSSPSEPSENWLMESLWPQASEPRVTEQQDHAIPGA